MYVKQLKDPHPCLLPPQTRHAGACTAATNAQIGQIRCLLLMIYMIYVLQGTYIPGLNNLHVVQIMLPDESRGDLNDVFYITWFLGWTCTTQILHIMS